MAIDTTGLWWQVPCIIYCIGMLYLTNKGRGNIIFSITYSTFILLAVVSATIMIVKLRRYDFDFKPAFFICLFSALISLIMSWIKEATKTKLFDGIISDSWRKKYFIGYCNSPACKRKDPVKIRLGRNENPSDLRIYCPDCKREVRGKIYN